MQFYYTPIFICLTSFSVTKIKEKKKPNSLILQNLKAHMVIRIERQYSYQIYDTDCKHFQWSNCAPATEKYK